MIDYTTIADLINRNLLGDPKISPEKHREVEFALLDAIIELQNSTTVVLAKGTVTVGDVAGDKRIVVSIPTQASIDYNVLGSLRVISGKYAENNDVMWSWGEGTTTTFAVYFGEQARHTQNLEFSFIVVPK